MAPAILLVRYPRGELPGHGFRCPRCGEEFLAMEEADRLRKEAHRIGLFGMEQKRRRKLQRTGNSITVSLDPELLREVLGGAGPGTVVEVGRVDDHIVVRRAES